jgi:hypothetical protein
VIADCPDLTLAGSRTAREALALLEDLCLPRVLREAPIDDEPETEEERAAIAEAREDLKAGRAVSHEQIRRELGIE